MVSDYDGADAAGRLVKLPMLRSMYPEASKPPCRVCPKAEGREPKPLPPGEDPFSGWLWDARDLFHEGRAVGDFGGPDPLMRAVFAAFDRAERRADRAALGLAVIRGLFGR